jgi:nitroimidazol reductase NimA-like FMN-containing flavoprotein (pyridoxamine 5'-phosphate oxidase superfamily)
MTVPVVRSVLAAPRRALSLAGAVRRGAVSNARSAAELIAEQVLDRERLRPGEGEGEGGPGVLTRLDPEQCRTLLRSRTVGRLAYVARAGVPDVVPVNYSVHGDDLLLRSGPGPKLQAAERREVVAVQVDDLDEQAHAGWSVVVHGRAERLHVAEAAQLPEEVLPRPWASGPRSAVVRVRVQRLDGRRLG